MHTFSRTVSLIALSFGRSYSQPVPASACLPKRKKPIREAKAPSKPVCFCVQPFSRSLKSASNKLQNRWTGAGNTSCSARSIAFHNFHLAPILTARQRRHEIHFRHSVIEFVIFINLPGDSIAARPSPPMVCRLIRRLLLLLAIRAGAAVEAAANQYRYSCKDGCERSVGASVHPPLACSQLFCETEMPVVVRRRLCVTSPVFREPFEGFSEKSYKPGPDGVNIV